jgi:hypothetical protein
MNLANIVDERPPGLIPGGWFEVGTVPNVQADPFSRDGRMKLSYAGKIYGIAYQHLTGLRMIYSIATMDDKTRWHHISFSREDKHPSWEEMKKALRFLPWFDSSRPILMVLPPEKDYVNIHEHCFHWWQQILPR